MDQADGTQEKTTVINTAPANNSGGNNGSGFLLGVIILVVIAILFLIYGLPYIRNFTGGNGVQINVPKSIDVHVNQSK